MSSSVCAAVAEVCRDTPSAGHNGKQRGKQWPPTSMGTLMFFFDLC